MSSRLRSRRNDSQSLTPLTPLSQRSDSQPFSQPFSQRRKSQKRIIFNPNPKTKVKSSPHFKSINNSKRLRKFFKNKNCNNLDIEDCIDGTIELVGEPVVINNGTFGILIKMNSSRGVMAVKFIFNVNRFSSAERINDMEKELAFSYLMSDTGIGPLVLDAFYYNINFGELRKFPSLHGIFEIISDHFRRKNKVYKQFLPIENKLLQGKNPSNLPLEIQCIVMESYENDCENALSDPNNSISIKVEIIKQMVNLLSEQIKHALYCYDIKPGNFVVNIKNGSVDVKMIDFGADFCTENKIYSGYENDDIVPDLELTYIDLLYISNTIQLFMMYIQSNDLYTMDKNDSKEIVNAFFNHHIFGVFFSKDWKNIILWYVYNARINNMQGLHDPSNNLIWYSNIENYSTDELYENDNIYKIADFIIYSLEIAIDLLGSS